MKTNIFSKLLTTYLVIILITLFIVAFFLTQLLQNYFYRAREAELIAKGQEVAEIFAEHLLGLQNPRVTADLLLALNRFLDASVQPVDKSMLALATYPGFEGMGQPLTAEEVEQILRGKAVAKRGYHIKTRERQITVAVPILVLGTVEGAVFLTARLTGITQTVSQMQELIFYAALLASALAMLVGFYMSKSISRPLQQMNRAAMEVAQGNYGQQVEVTSSDEVGQLAATFNNMAATLQQTVEDLSREKAKLENIMVSMNEGVLAVDRQGKALLANPQARKLLRLPAGELAGKPLAGLLPQPAMAGLFATVMETGRQHSAEYTLEGGRILLLQAAPLRRPGETWGAVGILQDVTEIRQMEQLRRDFVANVSHELRTPMTSIQGFVEALLDGLAEDKASRLHYLQIILAETVRLNRLITDLLDLSRLEMQQISLPLKPVDLAALIRDVAAKLQPQVEKNSLELQLELPERLPPVSGNYDRLQQVLINLCSNAISFTPPGGRITVTAREEGELVMVLVSDTGPGIPEEEQDKIWQRFHRVDKARSRSLGGTGLGLAIVKQIIEAHGGSVGLESVPGEGATFSFTLKTAQSSEV